MGHYDQVIASVNRVGNSNEDSTTSRGGQGQLIKKEPAANNEEDGQTSKIQAHSNVQLNRLPQNYFVNQDESEDYGAEDGNNEPLPLLYQQSSEHYQPLTSDINDILQPERFVERYMQQIEQQEKQEQGEENEQIYAEGQDMEDSYGGPDEDQEQEDQDQQEDYEDDHQNQEQDVQQDS